MNNYNAYSKIFNIPTEILEFYFEVFDLYEIRANVGNVQGILFEVRSRESNYNIPHIHAKYGEFQISISIIDCKVLNGNLHNKQQRNAINWVKSNRTNLLTKWDNLTLKAKMPLVKSGLD